MKTMIYFAMLILALLSFSALTAASSGSIWGYGIEGGVARGDNADDAEEFVPSGRGFMQMGFTPNFMAQIGVTYAPLNAGDVYETKTLMGDVRFLIRPIHLGLFAPYIYAGFGAAKDLKDGGAVYVPIVPAGVGFHTSLGRRVLLDIHGGYNVALSDKLDSRVRAGSDLNRITNGKNDGFYSLMFGLTISNPYEKKSKKPVAEVIVPEPEAKPVVLDTDKDGLNDDIEISTYKTDPYKADSDSDGLSDRVEVMQYKTDPNKADTDGDGLNDFAEVNTYRTEPLKIDTDGGGLSDGAEVRASKKPLDPKDDIDVPEKVVIPEAVPAIDPTRIDTDNDGLMDTDELNKYRTDPTKLDTDGDGINDGDEIVKYRSDPLKADTDLDGITDGKEISIYKTNPAQADSDNDGLNDYEEVNTYRTDPLKIDTDGGGNNDGAEIKSKKDPLNPKDDQYVPQIKKKMVLSGIKFASGKAQILPESEMTLEQAYDSLKVNTEVSISISGHTDSVGNDDSNRSLSLRRAQAVKDWLVNRGINATHIKVVGKGEAEPIASNDTSEGRAQNRRIEIDVLE